VTASGAAIFDLDGLLVDSEVLWHKAELEILVPLGAPIDQETTRATKGMFVEEVVRYWHGLAGWGSPSDDEVVASILSRVGALVESEGRLLPGARRAVELAAGLGPTVLASSTPRSLIDRVLAHFDLDASFASIHSAEDEDFGKPHPAVFLTAAAATGVAPPSCVVFEDSQAGVIAAKAARMGCVAVPAAEERGAAAFGLADLVLDTLEDFEEGWLAARYRADQR